MHSTYISLTRGNCYIKKIVTRQQTQKEVTMPTNIRIIHAGDFVVANPEGQIDLEKSEKLLMEVASASAPMVDHEII